MKLLGGSILRVDVLLTRCLMLKIIGPDQFEFTFEVIAQRTPQLKLCSAQSKR